MASSTDFIWGLAGASWVPSQPWASLPPVSEWAPAAREPPAGSFILRLTRALWLHAHHAQERADSFGGVARAAYHLAHVVAV